MLTNREVIAVKIESTYNTDPTPNPSTDAVLIENVSFSYTGQRMVERPAIRTSLGGLKPLYGGSLGQITFDCEIKGSGAAGTAPELDALYQACGLGATVVASTSVTYKPASVNHKSVTIYYYQDGKLRKLTGCRGEVTFKLAVGNKAMASFTMTGHTSAPTDVALPTAAYDSTVPAVMINTGFTVDSYSAIIDTLEFSLGNQISTPANIAAVDGYGEVRIGKRQVQGSFDPEEVLVATYDFDAKWRTGAAMALSTNQIGSAGNRFQVTMPSITYIDVGQGDRDGTRTLQIPFRAMESTGDDELSLIFT